MKVVLFGATGMVGQGVLRECLLEAEVETVLAVGRSPTGQRHAKLHEIVHNDFLDFSRIESQLAGYDACFFCLGVSSIGMSEERYRRLTYDITLAAARTLAKTPHAATRRRRKVIHPSYRTRVGYWNGMGTRSDEAERRVAGRQGVAEIGFRSVCHCSRSLARSFRL